MSPVRLTPVYSVYSVWFDSQRMQHNPKAGGNVLSNQHFRTQLEQMERVKVTGAAVQHIETDTELRQLPYNKKQAAVDREVERRVFKLSTEW